MRRLPLVTAAEKNCDRARHLFPSSSRFIFQIHLRQRQNTSSCAGQSIRSNLNGCKWFHYRALKGSEQENEAGCGG